MYTSNKRNSGDRKSFSRKRDDIRPIRERKSSGSEKSHGLVRVIKKKFASQEEGREFSKERKSFSNDNGRKPFRGGETESRTRVIKKNFSSTPDDTKYRSKRRGFSEDSERKPFKSIESHSRTRVIKKKFPSNPSNTDYTGEKGRFSRDYEVKPSNPKYSEKPIVRITSQKKADDGLVRLNKIIASSGICSRREADAMISAGLVSVNGKVITELGTKVNPADDIRYNGERLRQERLVYILLNKPKDYVATLRDPYAKRTVLDLIKGACKERVFPVGRLDRNTTGVLLLTNEGELTKQLTHPSHNRKKVYHVHIDQNLRQTDLETIQNGLELEDGFIKADEISFVDPVDKKQIGIEIHSGRNRVVRRIFEQLGYKVMKLDRVYFSGLTKKGLQRGQWRFLTNQEIGMLKMGSYV
jgi:23S rRNA pseudouridine2605 synthase